MPRSYPTPADPRQPHPLRLLRIGFWNTKTIAICFIIIDEAVSSFRECGLSYGLCDALCTLQPFRSALTSPPHGCNTRYEWLVRPYSAGTFTQSETPSFAWRTGVLISTLRNPGDLCGSAVINSARALLTAEAQRTPRLRRDISNLRHNPKC
jgi:hypothetical protein